MPTRADYKVTRTATLKVGVPGIGTGGQLTVPAVLSNIYGMDSFNTQGQESSIDFNTFDNEGTDELINNRRWQISCSAFEINGTNPGLAIIKTALKGLGDDAVVYFEFEDQDDDGVKGFATVKGESIPREVDAPMRISWTFGVLGKIYDLSEAIT